MPINSTRVEDGEDFELLCEAQLYTVGFIIEAEVARGPDRGRDIIASETMTSRARVAETHLSWAKTSIRLLTA